ncbi:MAG: hypothetical protein MZV65_48010 [Chromatiales bacterium]|nr:hypothetical protein [Chromatiales bacterium]
MLKGKEITESALIDALTPEETVSHPFHQDHARSGDKPLPPPKPAAASLLITFETNSAELTPTRAPVARCGGRAR